MNSYTGVAHVTLKTFSYLKLEIYCKVWLGPKAKPQFSEDIAIRNGKIFWKVVWIQYYLQSGLISRRY